jgi:Mrp family chromosome partitioning ATPase
MGKMLETLNQRLAQQGTGAALPATQPAPCPRPQGEPEGDPPPEMPFIEVGGRLAPLEGSPDVLASAPPARHRAHPAHAERGPRLQRITSRTPNALTVQFRPMAAGMIGARPRFAPELIAFHRPDHAISRQYQVLADELLAHLPAAAARVLLFTSAARGVGTTTAVLNLAITFARQEDRRVIVVDANWDRAAIAGRLGLADAPGLIDVLAGLPLEQALQETGQAGLRSLSGGAAQGSPIRATLGTLRPLFRELRDACDLVLVDAPCRDEHPDAAALADAVYLVTPAAEAESLQVVALLQRMRQQGIPVRGQVLTAH